MVQIIQRQREHPSVAIGRQLGGIGQAANQAYGSYLQGKQHQELEKEYGKLSTNPEIQKAQIVEKLRSQSRMGELEHKTGINSQEEERIYNTISNEFGPDAADLYAAATTGGKTKYMDYLLRAKKRGDNFDQKYGNEFEDLDDFENVEDIIENQPENKPQKPKISKEIKEYLQKQDEGLLPEEKIKRGEKRYDTNLKFYQEAGTKLRAFSADRDRFNVLDSINNSDKLPSNLARLNVDSEGNLRAPFLANAETQRFIKTLNEFSQNAKDTFGSRVTNFDLTQYLKRFPTALNTKEGRRQILQQMRLVNQINSVYYKNLKNVYDKAGGVRNIDADAAERFAEKVSEPKIKSLSEKFKEIGQFSSKPSAEEFKGKKIRDTKTGEVYVSDGMEWVPFNQEIENAL